MNHSLGNQVLGLLQTGHEGISHLESCIHNGKMSMSDLSVLDALRELLIAVEDATAASSLPHRVKEINENIHYYIEQLLEHIEKGDIESFLYDFRFHLRSLFRILELEVAYIVEKDVNKLDYPRFYPEVGNVDLEEITSRGKEAEAYCKVSVVLLSYNNLDVTRDCVESILTNTNDVEYELILVDNGSTDGTKEYFESIPGAKVIYLKHNLHVVKGFNIGMMAAEGKYSAVVCNDFIFTPRWLKNILTCIESDSSIGYVSPGATFISNMQQINVPFYSKEDFQERAKDYNISNPSKWEERVVLLPNVLCCPTALLERIGYYDTRFYRGEFGDDDISFRIRRAGYKLVYCADTVTHHYGSLTTASDHLLNSIEEGRQIFLEKYGIDAWKEARMKQVQINRIVKHLPNVDTILGIDVNCGATVLQIKNLIWSLYGKKPHLTIGTTDDKYLVDIETIANHAFTFDHLHELTEQAGSDVDLVYIEKPLDEYIEDVGTIFTILRKVMKKNGKLFFSVNNPASIEGIYKLLNSSATMHNRKIFTQGKLCEIAMKEGFSGISVVDIVPERSEESNQKVVEIASSLAGGTQSNRAYMESILFAEYFLYEMSYRGK